MCCSIDVCLLQPESTGVGLVRYRHDIYYQLRALWHRTITLHHSLRISYADPFPYGPDRVEFKRRGAVVERGERGF